MAKVTQLVTVVLLSIAACLFAQAAYGATGMTDEETKQVSQAFDGAIQRYDDWLTRMYELTPEQKDQVHNHLVELKQAQLDWGPSAEAEMNDISKELRYYIEQAREGKPVDKQKVQDLQDRMVGVVNKAPLSMNNAIIETEKFLPPEQAQAGRQRIAEYNDKIAEMAAKDKASQTDAPSDLDALKPLMKDQSNSLGLALPPVGASQQAAPAKPATPVAVAPSSAPASLPSVTETVNGDDWTRYVEKFIEKYQLEDRQQKQAWQIHGELQKRADEYRKAHKSDYEAVERIEKKDLAAKELKDLNKPILEMFAELKTRLNTIPTDEQRKVADAVKAPATRRATASAPASRPSSSQPTSRPAGRTTARPARAPASRGAAAPSAAK